MQFLLFFLALFIVTQTGFAEVVKAPIVPPALVIDPATDLNKKASSAEDIAFHFHRKAGVKPDTIAFIESTPAYQKADAALKQKMIRNNATMLDMSFLNFVPSANPIIVRTKVGVKAIFGNKNGLDVRFAGQDLNPKSPIYFPYAWGKQNFAVLANGIENFAFLPMKLETASNASRKINKDGTATFIFELSPISADAQKPFKLDGIDQWLLMTSIKRAHLVNEYLEVLWSYEAP